MKQSKIAYMVYSSDGDIFETYAVSEAQALNNIRYKFANSYPVEDKTNGEIEVKGITFTAIAKIRAEFEARRKFGKWSGELSNSEWASYFFG